MTEIPIYTVREVTEKGGLPIDQYIATLLMPRGIMGYGPTPEAAKEDLKKKITEQLSGLSEFKSDSIEIDL